MTAAAPPLAPDLVAGLKRLKLRRIREIAPETLQAAKTQRWAPEELLRTFVEAEIAARDEANAAARLRSAGFPVRKTLEEFALGQSSVPRATYDYLASLEWIPPAENVCLVGPAGTGKSHCETGSTAQTKSRGRIGPVGRGMTRMSHWLAEGDALALDLSGPSRRHRPGSAAMLA